MYVVKRNGEQQLRDDSKFERQIEWACSGLNVDPEVLKAKAQELLHDGIHTTDLHRAITKAAADLISVEQPDWTYVAARSVLQELYKVINGTTVYHSLLSYLEEGVKTSKISSALLDYSNFDHQLLQFTIDRAVSRGADLNFDYLGIQTLADRYLLRDQNGKVIELPQHFFMRIAMGIAMAESTKEEKTNQALAMYHVLSNKLGSPSSPTLFNSGTDHPQLSSCFGSYMDDSIDGIFSTLSECGNYSKFAGGCSIYVGAIRSQGSSIKSTGGKAGGPTPYAVMYDATIRGFDQSGKRRGVGAFYLDVWHADVFEFLKLKEPGRDPRMSTFDTMPALMIPDLFMERVLNEGDWSLFDPKEVPDLLTTYGKAFTNAYKKYEREGKAKQSIPALSLWHEILTKVYQHGMYWPCFRDRLNERYPQIESGLVHNSNLCTEIALRNDPGISFVCNLASINLGEIDLEFNHETRTLTWSPVLEQTVRTLVRALDNVVTIGTIPHQKGSLFQGEDRAVGLGVMGWTVALTKLGIDYESDDHLYFANSVYQQISATAIHQSHLLSQERGAYPTFEQSQWAKGILPFDTVNWTEEVEQLVEGLEHINFATPSDCPFLKSWADLQKMVSKGMRNSCLMAIAPTATIANIMGTSQCTEMPWDMTSQKENLSGQFTVVSPVLLANKHGLKLKAARDIDHKWTVKAAALRQMWIDQSQSTNFFLNPVALRNQFGSSFLTEVGYILDDLYFLAWGLGLKTTYYVYSQAPDVSALIANAPGQIQEFDAEKDGPACFLRPGDPGFSECEACQ